MVYRRLLGPGLPSRIWRFKKSLLQHIEEPPDHALGRSRGGFGSKFHLVTDGRGLPLAVEVTAGQSHESKQVEAVLNGIAVPQPVGRARKRPRRLAGDKAYSFPGVRDWLREHGITAVIPRRSNQKRNGLCFDKQSYRRRCVIEQCVGWLKECRRIGTRFDKLAISFLAMFKLAMIQRYLRVAFSDTA
jgi:transposase